MRHISITRPAARTVAVLGLATAGLAGLGLTAPAQAATLTPTLATVAASPSTDPKLCAGDLCVQNIREGVQNSTIKASANTTGFYGHFELKYDDGHVRNSPNQYWRAGGTGYDFKGVPPGDSYQMTAWKGHHKPYTNIGRLGFSVG